MNEVMMQEMKRRHTDLEQRLNAHEEVDNIVHQKVYDLEQRLVIHELHIDIDRGHRADMIQEMQLTQQTMGDLAEAVRNLNSSTSDLKDIIEAWRAMNGVIKTGAMVGKFMQWLSGFAVVGAFIAWWTTK
jgi:hypothetical protein